MKQYNSLERFCEPQRTGYAVALEEMRRGKKQGEWMWYIFPHLRQTGRYSKSWDYGIEDLEEAKRYLAHPVLGPRLREITQVLLEQPESDPEKIFGGMDKFRFRFCMTLFAQASTESLFQQALDKFYGGVPDPLTLYYLNPKGAPPQ